MALLDPGVFTDGVNKTASTHHLAIPEALLHSRGLHSGRVTSLTGLRRVTRAEEPTRASEPEPEVASTHLKHMYYRQKIILDCVLFGLLSNSFFFYHE